MEIKSFTFVMCVLAFVSLFLSILVYSNSFEAISIKYLEPESESLNSISAYAGEIDSVTYGQDWENRTFVDGKSIMINGVSNVYDNGLYKPFSQVYNLQRDGRFIKIIGSDFNVTLDWGLIQTNGVYRDSLWILTNYPSVASRLNRKTLRNLFTWNMNINVANLPAVVRNNVQGFYFKLHSVEGNISWSDVSKVERQGNGYNYSVIILKDAVLNFENPARNGIDVTINRTHIIYNNIRNAVTNGQIDISNSLEHLNKENLQNISAKFIGYDEGMDVEINKDNLNLYKWNREAGFNINLGNSSEGLVWENDTFRNVYPDYEIIQYPKNNNSFEFEIKLDSIPPRNWIEFDIDTTGLNFLYQPPLRIEDYPSAFSCNATDCIDSNGINIAHRPINIVNSYAVYSKALKNNEYQTGKLFHIYRPWVNDSLGNLIWATITINETTGKMRIDVPQSYLDNAVYPVIIDPEFGYTTAGGSNSGLFSGEVRGHSLLAQSHSASTGDTITGFSAYAKTYSSPATIDIGVYTYVSGLPNTKTGASGTITSTSSGVSWLNSTSVSISLTTGTSYVLAEGDMSANQFRMYYDTSTDSVSRDTSTGSLPATWNHDLYDPALWSMYATYTTGGGTDTCSCPSTNTNWEIDLSDNCDIVSSCDIGTGNLTFIGVGSFTCNETISVNKVDWKYSVSEAEKYNVENNCRMEVLGL